jgi:hypothetical protein
MNRPQIEDRSKVRSVIVHVRANEAQRIRWQQAADKQDMRLSEWLRYVANRAARTG